MATVIDRSWYGTIVRTPTQALALYPETVDDSNLNYPMAMALTETSDSDATNTNQSRSSTRFDLFRNFGAEKAHLLSNAKLCHKAFGYIAGGATGKVDGTKETRLKLLNGVKPSNSSGKISHSGLKHHKYNKFYLFLQGTYYDSKPPSMLTIPLLDLEDVLGWNGTDEYDVMAITFGEDAPFCQAQVLSKADRISGNNAQVKARVEKGRQLLEAFIKGLASSDLQHPVEENFGLNEDEGQKYQPYQQWLQLLAEIRNSENPKSIHLPEERKDVDWSKVNVAIGRADLRSSLPDPFCMAVKAAINYSSYRGMALLPSCPPASETSSNEEVNTLQGNDDDSISGNSGRDFSAVARSFQNQNRRLVEMFSSE